MARSLTDAAIVLNVIAGKDPNDNATLSQPEVLPDLTKALVKTALDGKRIGVPRLVFMDDSITGNNPAIGVAFETALEVIRSLGATVIDPSDLPSAEELVAATHKSIVLRTDFKVCFYH